MKLYLAGGMGYRELLFGGAIMDLYLAIGGGQWNKYVAPTVNVPPPIEAGASCFSENSTTNSEELWRLTLSPQA